MCPTARNTKGTTQVILHMLLSCFFNTCTLCLCHPVLLSDINLWHTDNQVWVSIYRATVNIQEVFLTFYKESIFHRFWLVKFIMVFTAGNRKCHELFCCNQWRRPLVDRKMLPNSRGFLASGVTFFFSEFSFNCTNGQYNGLRRCGDKRSGPETEPLCIEFQA